MYWQILEFIHKDHFHLATIKPPGFKAAADLISSLIYDAIGNIPEYSEDAFLHSRDVHFMEKGSRVYVRLLVRDYTESYRIILNVVTRGYFYLADISTKEQIYFLDVTHLFRRIHHNARNTGSKSLYHT